MKKTFLLIFVILITTAFVIQTTTNRSAATVEQRDGLYIFLLSKPAAAYEVQGSVKVGLTITSNPLDVLIRKCKKDHPSADGLLISDPNLQNAKADCIKFKE